MERLYGFFSLRPWYQLVPDEKHEVVVDGLGEFYGMDYLTAARASDGSTVMAYMPTSRTIAVQMNSISGKEAVAWWFNPRTGQVSEVGKFPTNGKRGFTPPSDGDWVLVLDDVARSLPWSSKTH